MECFESFPFRARVCILYGAYYASERYFNYSLPFRTSHAVRRKSCFSLCVFVVFVFFGYIALYTYHVCFYSGFTIGFFIGFSLFNTFWMHILLQHSSIYAIFSVSRTPVPLHLFVWLYDGAKQVERKEENPSKRKKMGQSEHKVTTSIPVLGGIHHDVCVLHYMLNVLSNKNQK